MNRREILSLATGAVGGTAFGAMGEFKINDYGALPVVQEKSDSLANLARRSNRIYGSAVRSGALIADPSYRKLLLEQAEYFTPEGEMKWGNVASINGRLDYARAEAIASVASANGRKLRGHTLCWHNSLPDWFSRLVSDQRVDEARKAFENFVSSATATWKGRVSHWDVANEILSKDGFEALRRSPLLTLYGDRLLDVAFGIARANDPSALLFYNDFGFEQDGVQSERKKRNLLNLLSALRNRKVPIDGVGLQTHLFMSAGFDPETYSRFLDEIGAMGLVVLITELDIDDHVIAGSDQIRQNRTAAVAHDLLRVALSKEFVIGVCTWGLTCRYSWLNDWGASFRRDLQPMACLPYDSDLQPNSIRVALADALSAATPFRKQK